MKITCVNLTLSKNNNTGLLAFATIVLDDCLKITDIKILEGPRLIMPTRLERRKCTDCSKNINCSANFCEHCGAKLEAQKKVFFNTAYPIHSDFRKYLEYVLFEHLKKSKELQQDLETRQSLLGSYSESSLTNEIVLS